MNRESCKGCIYQGTYFGNKGCNYLLITHRKRNCDPAHCTKKITLRQQKEQEKKNKRSMADWRYDYKVNETLKKKMKELQISQKSLSEMTNIPLGTLKAKINQVTKKDCFQRFNEDEKTRIAEVLGLSVEIIQ